ncbi:MAG TPA: hypothetical protein VGM90_17590 [Kofleriaceae bacterium]|jgi:hypothetical protein
MVDHLHTTDRTVAPAPTVQPPASTEHADQVRELRGHIPPQWSPALQLVPAAGAPPASAAIIAQIKSLTYRLLFDRTAGYEAFAAYLGADPSFLPYKRATDPLADNVQHDREPMAQVMAVCALMASGFSVQDGHSQALAAYVRLTFAGRHYVRDLAQVNSLADTPVKHLLHGDSALVPLDPPESTAAATGPQAPTGNPALDAAYNALRTRLMTEDPGNEDPAHQQSRDRLAADLRSADGRVLDRLRADPTVSLRIAALTIRMQPSAGEGASAQYAVDMDNATDSVRQLYGQVFQVGDENAKFNSIKAYLEARPGDQNLGLRSRVVQDAALMTVINGFSGAHQQQISRLVARGSMTRQPIDIIHDAAGTNPDAPRPSAEESLRAAIQLAQSPQLAGLRTDALFRHSLDLGSNAQRANIDGVSSSARDFILRLWGVTPNVGADAESALPTGAVDPTASVQPPSPAELQEIDRLFAQPINEIAAELTEWFVDDEDMIRYLTGFETRCANPHIRSIFERMHMNPGAELLRRCNADSRIGDLRARMHRRVGEQARQVCERVLGIRVDAATVGRIDGQVQLADQASAQAAATIPLAQALRSTQVAGGGTTVSLRVRTAAEGMKDKLNEWHLWGGAAGDDIIHIFQELRFALLGRAVLAAPEPGAPAAEPRTVIQELQRMTGIGTIHPIELLVNDFHEVPGGGDLSGKINERVTEADRPRTLSSLGLDAHSIDVRNRRPAPPTPGQFEAPATELWNTLLAASHLLGGSGEGDDSRPDMNAIRAAGVVWARVRALGAQPDAQTPAPVAGQPVASATPTPDSFHGVYRSHYGIEPERHVIEIGRAAVAHSSEQQASATVAQALGINADLLRGAAHAPTGEMPASTASGFSASEATDIATRIWQGFQRTDFVPLRQNYEGRRPEERELINRAFRNLSGDVDIQFFVRQMAASANGGGERMGVGLEGAHDANATDQAHSVLASDAASWNESLEVVTSGRVSVQTRVRNALANSNRNEIFRLADEATPADRREILGDEPTMGQLRAQLTAVDYDRVFAVLSGTADMATRLYSRSEGDVNGVWRWVSSTDTEGMKRDIREYASRRREFHTRRFEDQGRDVRGDENVRAEIQSSVRQDLLTAFENPAVRSVIDQEFPAWTGSASVHNVSAGGAEIEGMLLNGGEADGTAALRSDGFVWSSDIVTQVRSMSVEERQRRRADPELMRQLWSRSMNTQNRLLVMVALQSDEASGEDHIGRMLELGSTGSSTEFREQLARLSPAEVRRLRSNPDWIVTINEHLNRDEQAALRAFLTTDTTTFAASLGATAVTSGTPPQSQAPGADAPTVAETFDLHAPFPMHGRVERAEVDRLGALRAQCLMRLRLGAGNSFTRLVTEAVEVFRADLKPHLVPAAAPTTDPPQAGATPAPTVDLDAEARRYETEVLRPAIWHEIVSVVRTAADSASLTSDNGERMPSIRAEEVIMDAVLKRADPSVYAVREDMHWYRNEREEILSTINRASPELLITRWTSVKNNKWHSAGGESLQTVYDNFKRAREAAHAPPGGTPVPAAATAEMQRWQRAFSRYVVEPSMIWETEILPHSGGMFANRDQTSRAHQQLDRDNPEFAAYRQAMNDRIRALDAGQVAVAINATGDDARMVASQLRSALTDFSATEEVYAQRRGDGQTFFGSQEGRQLDQAFGAYRGELTSAEDQAAANGDVSDRQRRELSHMDDSVRERGSEYQAAREQAANVAAMVVGTVFAVIATALTAGAATPLAMCMYGALTSAAAATGEVLTREAIQGREYDASGDGVREIASAAATGFVAAGAQFYTGRLMSGILNQGTALAQGQAITAMTRATPGRWAMMLDAGGRTLVQSSMTGLADTAGSMLSPAVWSHGWDEGWIRAEQRGRESIRNQPLSILRQTITAMVGSWGGQADHVGEAVRPGERLGMGRVVGQIRSDMPSTLLQTGADVAIGIGTGEIRDAQSGLMAGAQGVSGAARGAGNTLQEGSVMRGRAEGFAVDEIREHPDLFNTEAEKAMYRRAVEDSFVHGNPPSAIEFATARNAFAASVAARNPEFLRMAPEEQRTFLHWVREAPTEAEFHIRMARNPREVVAMQAETGTEPPTVRLAAIRSEADALATRHTSDLSGTITEQRAQAETDLQTIGRLETRVDAVVALAQLNLDSAQRSGAANLESLRTELQRAQELAQTVRSLLTNARLGASGVVASARSGGGLEPGVEPPAHYTADQLDIIREANRRYRELMNPANPRFSDETSARLAWARYLSERGIEVSHHQFQTDTAHDRSSSGGNGSVREVSGHPVHSERQQGDSHVTPSAESVVNGAEITTRGQGEGAAAVNEFGDGSRMPNVANMSIEHARAAGLSLVDNGGIPNARRAQGGGGDIIVTLANGHELRINIVRPRDTSGAVAQSDYHEGATVVNVWCSDRILDQQAGRALGGIIGDVIARASVHPGSEAARVAPAQAAREGQLRAMFAQLAAARARGEQPAATTEQNHEQAMEQGRSERTGRISAELQEMMREQGLIGPDATAVENARATLPADLRALIVEQSQAAVGFNAEAAAAQTRREAPQATAQDLAVTNQPGGANASSVLPPPPTGEIRSFSAEDYPRISELRLHLEAIREMDTRLAARDQGGSASGTASPALGESLRRREHVDRVRALLSELQIGGTNREFISQRLADLQAVFPGAGDIASAVNERVTRRIEAVDSHSQAAQYRQVRRDAQDAIIAQITSTRPFVTERVIVGGGMAGTSRAAALGVTPEANAASAARRMLVLGGEDPISTWVPTEHWGQRAGAFTGSDHPMLTGEIMNRTVEDQGEFMHVGELNDSVELARQRMGLVPIEARVTRVEVAGANETTWAEGVNPAEHPVRLHVTIGNQEVIIYTAHSDLTTGLGQTGMPNEGILDPQTRATMLATGPNGEQPLVMGGERMMRADAGSMTGKRVLVVAFGPTGAWAAMRAAELGASVDWGGTRGSTGNLGDMRRAAGIDRTQESFSAAAAENIHRTTDQILNIRQEGNGAIVTYVYEQGGQHREYEVRYDQILMTQGFDSAGAHGAAQRREAPSASGQAGDTRVGSIIQGMDMQPQPQVVSEHQPEMPNIENAGLHAGAVTVYGAAAFDGSGLDATELSIHERRQGAVSGGLLSSDSPDARTLESVGHSVRAQRREPPPPPPRVDAPRVESGSEPPESDQVTN